jgi:hypothetical protein
MWYAATRLKVLWMCAALFNLLCACFEVVRVEQSITYRFGHVVQVGVRVHKGYVVRYVPALSECLRKCASSFKMISATLKTLQFLKCFM